MSEERRVKEKVHSFCLSLQDCSKGGRLDRNLPQMVSVLASCQNSLQIETEDPDTAFDLQRIHDSEFLWVFEKTPVMVPDSGVLWISNLSNPEQGCPINGSHETNNSGMQGSGSRNAAYRETWEKVWKGKLLL